MTNINIFNLVDDNYSIEQIDMNQQTIDEKIDLIISKINTHHLLRIIYKIEIWDSISKIKNIIQSNSIKEYELDSLPYKEGVKPGIVMLQSDILNDSFIRALLLNHLNFELSLTPSINMKLNLCIITKSNYYIYNIYDDRGFNIYTVKPIEQ